VKVLEGIDFSLEQGEVRALLGANGAGKSTLIKIVGGVHSQTSGEVFLKGRKVAFKNEHDSKSHGISIIYQELSLVPTLTVVQNMFLGRESAGAGGVFRRKCTGNMDASARTLILSLTRIQWCPVSALPSSRWWKS